MNTLNTNTFDHYANFLKDRLITKQHLTEDSVRYSFFFAALETTGIQQHEIILELPHPHPKFESKEIDTYILPTAIRVEHYIEFKFHRAARSRSATPQKAGSLFKDFGRLATVKTKQSRCLVVYLTDAEMAEYFDKHRTAYSAFWDQRMGSSFPYDDHFMSNTRNTVKNVCGDVHRAEIFVTYSVALPKGYHLRVYEIREHQTQLDAQPLELSPALAVKKSKPRCEIRATKEVRFGGFLLRELESRTIEVEREGTPISPAYPVLKDLAGLLNVSVLNSNGNPFNTRQLGSLLIRTVAAQQGESL